VHQATLPTCPACFQELFVSLNVILPLLCVHLCCCMLFEPVQRYIATASVAYQREIVRLYTALQKLDPLVKPPLIPKAVV